MRIDEAVKAINNVETVRAFADSTNIFAARKHFVGNFLCVPNNATDWDRVEFDPDALYDIKPLALRRVLNVVAQLLETPIKERQPEKKYCLRWIDDEDGAKNYLHNSEYWDLGCASEYAWAFTESELEKLKRDNPRLAPAIEAMKEEVKDDEAN